MLQCELAIISNTYIISVFGSQKSEGLFDKINEHLY